MAWPSSAEWVRRSLPSCDTRRTSSRLKNRSQRYRRVMLVRRQVPGGPVSQGRRLVDMFCGDDELKLAMNKTRRWGKKMEGPRNECHRFRERHQSDAPKTHVVEAVAMFFLRHANAMRWKQNALNAKRPQEDHANGWRCMLTDTVLRRTNCKTTWPALRTTTTSGC